MTAHNLQKCFDEWVQQSCKINIQNFSILEINTWMPKLKINTTYNHSKIRNVTRHWWLMLVILAIQKAEITVGSQPRQIVHEPLSRKKNHKNRAGGVSQGEGPEFKPQYCGKKKKRNV
jgi:hypothetical protein